MNPRDTKNLPSSGELRDIISAEAKRDIPLEKRNAHYPNFDTFIHLLQSLNIPTDVVTDASPPEAWTDGNELERANALMIELVNKLLRSSVSSQPSILDAVYDYLSEEDASEKADAIFVFGAKTLLRAEKAIELFQSDLADKLVFSGKSRFSDNEQMVEAKRYKQVALEKGVPEHAIILEEKSITIPDNVRSSLNLFDRINFHPQSIILVNSPYAQRRGWCLFKKYTTDDVVLMRQNCPTAKTFSRSAWYTTEEGIRVIANEFIKMKIAVALNTS